MVALFIASFRERAPLNLGVRRMAKVRTGLTVVIMGYMIILFTYGLVRYPDAPIHPCITAGYCGKQGQPRTQREYTEFLTWQSALEWSWPFGMLALFFLNREKIRFRRSAPRQ
jgi:hypothetical protein